MKLTVRVGTGASRMWTPRDALEAPVMRTTLATMFVLFAATATAADPPAAVAKLVRALQHKDGTIRLHAAAALGELGAKAKAARPALVKALDDPHPIVRFYAAEAIGKVGGKLTWELKARLMKVVKTDKSWIVARQAALSLERLDPKGLWAHAILLQYRGDDSSVVVVKSPSPPALSSMSIAIAVMLLKAPKPNGPLSALHYLNHVRIRRAGDRQMIGARVLPLMFHASQRVRTAARRFLSESGADGVRAVQLADLAADAKNKKKLATVLQRPGKGGPLTLQMVIHIRKRLKQIPPDMQIAALLAIARNQARNMPDEPADPRGRPFSSDRDYRHLLKLASDAESREYWRRRLRAKDVDQVLNALKLLARSEIRAPSLSKDVAIHGGDSNAAVRDAAMRALLRTQPDWRSIAGPVKALLNSKEAEQRRWAIHLVLTLKSVRRGALPQLRRMVRREPLAELRKQIVNGFHKFDANDAATVATLTKVVAGDPDADVRLLAAKTIGRFGRKASNAVKPLFAALQTEKDPAVKLQIALAIDHCVKPQSRTRAVLAKLIVEYGRQVATAALRDVIRRQSELAKDVQRRNVRDILGLKSQP